MSKPLEGIVPPLVTPLKAGGVSDVEGMERLVEHVLAGGVHGVFALGTTGEAVSLSSRVKRETVKRVCSLVNGRVPVLVGIMDTSFEESLALAGYAYEQGASGVVTASPYYFRPSQEELTAWFQGIAAQSPLPVYIYNIPGCVHVSIEPETVRVLSENPNVAGYKDSSYNMVNFHQVRLLLNDRPDFSMFVGPGELLAESVLLGGQGGVNGGANIFPELYVDLYNAAVRKDMTSVLELQRKVVKLCSTIYCLNKNNSSTICGIKCALDLIGICRGTTEKPFQPFGESEQRKMKEILGELSLSPELV